MPTIEVFETSRTRTGANAPNPNGLYARQQFGTGLQWLESRGVHIERHAIPLDGTLAIDNGTVKTATELQGEDALPITVLNDTIISIGGYLPEEHQPARLVCYCFGHTVAAIQREVEATGTSGIAADIREKCAQGLDQCSRTNPEGKCCLGNVQRVVREASGDNRPRPADEGGCCYR